MLLKSGIFYSFEFWVNISEDMRTIIIFISFFISVTAYSQTKQDSIVQKLFNQAEQKTSDSLYSEAINLYKIILRDYQPDPGTYGRVKYNLGYLYYYLDNISEAKKCFKELINADHSALSKKQKAGLIITELQPFHKHFASVQLAEIALKEKDYKLALYYIKLFETKFKYESYCGSANEDYRYYKLIMYARVSLGLGDTTKALDNLLPHLFEYANYYLVDFTVGILEAKFNKQSLLTQFNNAADHVVPVKTKTPDGTRYYVTFLNKTIDATSAYLNLLPGFFGNSDSASVAFSKDYLKASGIPENYDSLPELEYKKLALRKSYFCTKLEEEN